MELPELGSVAHHITVPESFYSDAKQAPFSQCVSCDTLLLKNGTQYVIEKAIRCYPKHNTKDTVFEYAMCLSCYGQMQHALSQDSMLRVRNYFDEHIDLYERRKGLLENETQDVKDWISTCLITGKSVHEMLEYQIFCQCDGSDMLFTYLPYLIGGDAIAEIAQLLSNKTLGEIDGFMDEHFGLPPEFRKHMLEHTVLLV